jgi:hypothetical protein
MKKTTKFIVIMAEVECDDTADVQDICEEVEVFCDAHDGSITKSTVVGQWDEMPIPLTEWNKMYKDVYQEDLPEKRKSPELYTGESV